MTDYKNLVAKTIEQHIGRAFAQYYPVIPLANLQPENGQGPRTLGEDRIVLPDFAVAAKDFGYFDVKVKAASNYYRNWNRDEHGINLAHFDAYRTFEQRFERHVALVVAELNTGKLLACTLSDLTAFGDPRIGTWSNNGAQSINWNRMAFTEVGTFDIPNDDLTRTSITLNPKPVQMLLRQLQLPLQEELQHA